jgi:TPR repeat protein
MARIELADINNATLGEAPAADTFFELGMMYSVGRSVPVDFVVAHKWFNLAAMRGNDDAVRLRQEIAAQMSEAEIAAAQRAARAWLKGMDRDRYHPLPIRAAAECRAP